MRAVDTNVVVRLVIADDPAQTAASEAFVREGAWLSTVALAESIWVLGSVYGRDAGELASVVEMLLTRSALVIENSETVASALNLFRSRPALGFSDCLILELAKKAGHLPLGTFDRRLATSPGAQKI
jgi:predicted nucleic-acid-binding protein